MKIYVENTNETFFCDNKTTILESLKKNHVEISSSCGGMGSCGTCRVLVLNNKQPLPQRNFLEQEKAIDLNYLPNERLACQFIPTCDLSIKIP